MMEKILKESVCQFCGLKNARPDPCIYKDGRQEACASVYLKELEQEDTDGIMR